MGWQSVSGIGAGFVPTQVAGCVLWLRADKGVVLQGMAAPVATGGGPAVTFTCPAVGHPTFATVGIEVQIDGAGALGVATFTWWYNGVLKAAGVLTAAFVVLTDGIRVNFPAGAYVVEQHWTSVPTVDTWTSSDGSATVFSAPAAANRPAYIAAGGVPVAGWPAGVNNQAALLFDGAATYLDAAGFGLANIFTVYAVANPITLGTTEVLWCSLSSQPFFYYMAAGGWAMGNPQENINASIPLAFPQVVSGVSNGLSGIAMPYGSPFNPGATAAIAGLRIGAYVGAIDYFAGQLCEHLLYSRVLSNEENAAVRKYLLTRYGV